MKIIDIISTGGSFVRLKDDSRALLWLAGANLSGRFFFSFFIKEDARVECEAALQISAYYKEMKDLLSALPTVSKPPTRI
jgi:hypothetical protein